MPHTATERERLVPHLRKTVEPTLVVSVSVSEPNQGHESRGGCIEWPARDSAEEYVAAEVGVTIGAHWQADQFTDTKDPGCELTHP